MSNSDYEKSLREEIVNDFRRRFERIAVNDNRTYMFDYNYNYDNALIQSENKQQMYIFVQEIKEILKVGYIEFINGVNNFIDNILVNLTWNTSVMVSTIEGENIITDISITIDSESDFRKFEPDVIAQMFFTNARKSIEEDIERVSNIVYI